MLYGWRVLISMSAPVAKEVYERQPFARELL
jgi:hypothetical protein